MLLGQCVCLVVACGVARDRELPLSVLYGHEWEATMIAESLALNSYSCSRLLLAVAYHLLYAHTLYPLQVKSYRYISSFSHFHC